MSRRRAASCCGGRDLVSQHDLHRIARCKGDHGKDDDADPQQHGDQLKDPFDERA